MGLFSVFQRSEAILGVDIGSSSLKVIQLDLTGRAPRVVGYGYSQYGPDVLINNTVSNLAVVGESIERIVESSTLTARLASVAIPGPSVFIKKIKMPKVEQEELARSIQIEAANFIPHNIDAIKMDFHVLGEIAKNQLEVLVVAVKNEILQSFTDAVAIGGLTPTIADVDYFAVQNAFERTPSASALGKTIALVDVGSKYSSVNIVKGGSSLFTGDLSAAGKTITDGLASELGCSPKEAEDKKRSKNKGEEILSAYQKQCEVFAAELNRQLSFFWNASASDDSIDAIVLSGGSVLDRTLVDAVSKKTGMRTEILDPFEGMDITGVRDVEQLKTLAPAFAVATGLALRAPGDKEIFVGGEK